MVIPFISIPINIPNNEVQKNIITAFNTSIPSFSPQQYHATSITNQPNFKFESLSEEISLGISFLKILLILYVSGVILLLFRFFRNIFLITHSKLCSEKINYAGNKLVLIDNQINPFCFFNTIFVGKQDYLNNKIAKELLIHELEHIRQSHSIDILFIELIQIIYWFNPILILYNKAIRVNHEYLADNGVIQDSTDIKCYADKLINFISCKRNIPLTSGFNPSLTRKRLIMLTKSKPNKIDNGVRIFLTLSLVAVFFLILSCIPSNSQPLTIVKNPGGFTGIQSHTLKDIDGNEYKTITIGTQVWMAENLKTTKYNDGTDIPLVTDDKQWQKYEPAFCWYNNDEAENKNKYGALYNWYVVNTNKLCPNGWHVTSSDELRSLVIFSAMDTITGGKLKETGTVHWRIPNKGATNETGFTALPGGLRQYSGEFIYLGEQGTLWISSEENNYIGRGWILTFDDSRVNPNWPSKRDGLSVRCLKNYSEEEINVLNNQHKTILDAQSPTNFSGKWKLNKKQSNLSEAIGLNSQTLIIKQEANSITLQSTFDIPDQKPLKRESTYILNGEETITKSGEKTQKVSAKWSLNKQSFTITTTLVSQNKGATRELKRVESYTLIDGGNTLVVKYDDTMPKDSIIPPEANFFVMVYNKK